MRATRWPWFAGSALASMLCLFLLFVLFVALPFDEVSEGPRRGTQAIVAGLALGSAAISVAFARRGLRAHGAGEDA